MKDVIIIGAGVIGSSIAMHLSKYNLDTLLIEKNPEACMETSKANSGIVHAGYAATKGSLKAELNVRSAFVMEELSKKLGFPYKKIGSLLICKDKDNEVVEELYRQGLDRKLPDICVLSSKEIRELEPNLSEDIQSALYAPNAAIICPFQFTYSLLENALLNGVSFQGNTKVKGIIKHKDHYELITSQGHLKARNIVSAAGLESAVISAMVGDHSFDIIPRRGEYRVLDHTEDQKVSHVIFQLPTEYSKGILALPTVHGNLLLGPTSIVQEDLHAKPATDQGITQIDEQIMSLFPTWDGRMKTIRLFSGLRASTSGKDFILKESDVAENFFIAAGIDSPGLSSAYGIGEYISNLVIEKAKPALKEDYIDENPKYHLFRDLPIETQKELLAENNEYGQMVCRCEDISLADVKNAIHRPCGARTLGGIKRRVRPGSGRCQGGFCEIRIAKILSEELHIPLEEVLKEKSPWIEEVSHV